MIRDMDLVRLILIQTEAQDVEHWYSRRFTVEGYDDRIVARHVELLAEAGLLRASLLRTEQNGVEDARVERITWEGYEFLEAIRDESNYKKAKELTISKSGGLVFDVLKDVLISMIKGHIFGSM